MTNKQIIKDTAEYNYKKGQEDERKRICRIILQLVDMDGLLYLDELMEKIKEKKHE